VRKRFKGWPARVSAGYRGPKSARALHPSGFEDVLVYNVDDLKQIDATTQAVRIAHAVGQRKRIQILTEARKKKIVVLNQRQVKEATKKEEESTEETEKDEAETEEANNTEKPTEEKKVSKPKKRTE
jgi:large subunit ribosomal protein L32e